MFSWRPVSDISAPIPIIDLGVAEVGKARREALAAPYFLILWRDECPIAQFRAFSRNEPPLDWQMVARACETLTVVPTPQTSRSIISLVICTRDRPQDLDRCLASLPSQDRRPDQVVVVDSASRTHETRQVAERHGVVYMREDRTGLDIARNKGAAVSRGDIIASRTTTLFCIRLGCAESRMHSSEGYLGGHGTRPPGRTEDRGSVPFRKGVEFRSRFPEAGLRAGILFPYTQERLSGLGDWSRREHGVSSRGV